MSGQKHTFADTLAAEGPRFIGSTTMVVLGPEAISVPRLVPAPPWEVMPEIGIELSHADLQELARVSRDGVVDVPDESSSSQLILALDRFGLLQSGEVLGSMPFEPADEPSAVPSLVADRGGEYTVGSPVSFGVDRSGRFTAYEHDGSPWVSLDADELWAIRGFATPTTIEAVGATLSGLELGSGGFDGLVDRLAASGFLRPANPSAGKPVSDADAMRRALKSDAAMRDHARQVNARLDATARDRSIEVGYHPARLVAVQVAGNIPPLSTGMVLAHAIGHLPEEAAAAFDMEPRWITHTDDIVVEPGAGSVYLFTSYLWSHERNLDFAAVVKAADPNAITVFGGPDCPASAADTELYLRTNPQVDVAVRGEGEVTFTEMLAALAPSLREGNPDLRALDVVPGLTYRLGDEQVRTADRGRLEDVNVVPSPYLTGVFDTFGHTRGMGMAIIETNRGCPYGCTFCDWGSATNSRIRKFDLDRVFAELEWCAVHEVPKIFMADANFGIFARDVDIARHVADLKGRYGFPQRFITNYAKNTVKHLSEIVTVLAEGEVISEGLLSLQSMDDDTLNAVRRSNIKLDKYEALAREFHVARMPLFVDLMMGLPGQTVGSLREDLQQCIDREVMAKCHATELLVNSPMNEPEYRSEHRIEVTRAPGPTGVGASNALRIGPSFVVATSSFTRDDYEQMHRMRRSYLMAENFGVLRHVTRFVRRETGMREIDLIEAMRADATADPTSWPMLALALLAIPDAMVPPVTWRWFTDEVGRYLVDRGRITPGSDLDTVLAVQQAVLPASGRRFPEQIQLTHDYPAWLATVLSAKDEGRLHDWERVTPRLTDFGPVDFEVSDQFDLCNQVLGRGSAIQAYMDWELTSPVARAVPAHYRIN